MLATEEFVVNKPFLDKKIREKATIGESRPKLPGNLAHLRIAQLRNGIADSSGLQGQRIRLVCRH